MHTITINTAAELYVIKSSHGVSCRGFDNVLRELRLIAARIKGFDWVAAALASVSRGSLEAYQLYQAVIGEVARAGIKTDTWFPEGTPTKVARVLEASRKERATVRLWFGDPDTGRDSLAEFEVHGRVGRSCGPFRVPLLIDSKPDALGGGPISTDRIVRIVDVASRAVLYQHRNWHLPAIDLAPVREHEVLAAGYTVQAVVEGGATHARFWDMPRAAHWLAMMSGQSLENPDA